MKLYKPGDIVQYPQVNPPMLFLVVHTGKFYYRASYMNYRDTGVYNHFRFDDPLYELLTDIFRDAFL